MHHDPGWTIKGSHGVIPTAPLKVGNERQHLMDDYVVEDCCACRRTVHQPKRHSANPLISSVPGEGGEFVHASVARDDEHNVFRMWVMSAISHGSRKEMTHYAQFFGRYFESEDGIQWQAPDLGLFTLDGLAARNIFIADSARGVSPAVTEMPPKWRHKGRYVMVYDNAMMGRRDFPDLDANGQRQQIAFSDDGIHWRNQEENPIFAGQSDTANNICYNPERDVFMLYRRPPINAGEIRRIGYSESADLIHWTQPVQVITSDELDPCSLYGMSVMRYHGVHLGFLQMFYLQDPLNRRVKPDKHMQVDCQLAWSRDGVHWQRHPQRPIFLENGPVGTYDWGMLFVGNGLVEREDRTDLYYVAMERPHISLAAPSHICMASLRRDGFVSVDAPEEGGMLTRPLECPGGRLHINARTSAGGSIRVAVRRGNGHLDGEWLPEWEHEQCVAFSADETDHVVNWKGQEGLDCLRGKAIRLHFRLERAELFSFWFQD